MTRSAASYTSLPNAQAGRRWYAFTVAPDSSDAYEQLRRNLGPADEIRAATFAIGYSSEYRSKTVRVRLWIDTNKGLEFNCGGKEAEKT